MIPEGAAATGLVTVAHGRRGIVEIDGRRRPFVPRGRRQRIVCGDYVSCEQPPGSEALLVTGIMPRNNVLARSEPQGAGEEIIAANLTQLIAVCAPAPQPDFFLIDRYLCAAELMRCRPVIAWNKCELAEPLHAAFSEYCRIGYGIVRLSARTGANMDTLRELLEGHVSILVGQSGVGKSSLVNGLVPDGDAAVGALSAAMTTGTHTTTAVVMYSVGRTGRLIDTPGVRDFIPAIDRGRPITHGFPELLSLAGTCRFANCEHDHEPGCTVKEAVAAGRVSQRRYESYLRLRSATHTAARRPGR